MLASYIPCIPNIPNEFLSDDKEDNFGTNTELITPTVDASGQEAIGRRPIFIKVSEDSIRKYGFTTILTEGYSWEDWFDPDASTIQNATNEGAVAGKIKNRDTFKEYQNFGGNVELQDVPFDILYLGQGGNQIKLNDQYSLYERSDEKIKDSYTGETLGNVETKVGLVEIVDSNSKFSVAKIIEANVDLESNFKPRKYMVKPYKSAKKLKQNEAKEKIEKKKKKINEVY